MSRFSVSSTPLDGVHIIVRQSIGDERGVLSRLFCADELALVGWQKPIVQVNHTRTQKQGAVRGMHFQYPPHAEMKLVSCIRGAVWDVAVDLRTASPTFLQWHAEELSADNHRALLINEGFAHGFQAMEDDVELVYLHSAPYAPQSEGGLNPRDPRLMINWPLPIADLSVRDSNHRFINNEFGGIVL